MVTGLTVTPDDSSPKPPQRHAPLAHPPAAILNLHRLAFAAVTDGFVPDANGDHFPDNYVAPPAGLLALFDVQINGNTLTFTNPGVAETSDFVSEGIELEFVMNLRENWTVLFNASQQQSVRTGSGETLRQLLYETPLANGRTLVETWPGLRIPLFSAPAQNPAATAGFLSTDFQNGILASYIGVSSQDNGPAQELRKWRFNGATNYRFARGPLKGGSVGLAARWQDKVAIGFPLTTLSGQRVIDATKPFYGPTEFNLDAWVGYERMLWKGKVKWHLQLNVRNLVGDQGLIPVQVQPTGEAAVYRIPEPRLWSLSSKFSF